MSFAMKLLLSLLFSAISNGLAQDVNVDKNNTFPVPSPLAVPEQAVKKIVSEKRSRSISTISKNVKEIGTSLNPTVRKRYNAVKRCVPYSSKPTQYPNREHKLQAKNAMMNYLSKKMERSQNLEIFTEKDLVSTKSQYGVKKIKNEALVAKDSENDDGQVIAGIPDMSDPCFRRYLNSIIVNAQPYERRSSIGLLNCKAYCIQSQSGVYSCRSFVYDNINRVCDLFAHVGDQAPARLLKFQSRDYFEPTNSLECLKMGAAEPPAPSPPQNNDWTRESAQALGATNKETKTVLPPPTTTPAPFKDQSRSSQCPVGKLPSYLRTEGFELYKNDDKTIDATEIGVCTTACTENQELDCKSFDFDGNRCQLTSEAAVPVGNGQLKQKEHSFYYEKICADEKFVRKCSGGSFNRFPQMILVGFAESVVDSPTFEHCFDTCLNSQSLFNFNCTSAMYYFEESSLNCILNSENRHTQRDLFTEENTDIVDYFEVECRGRTRARAAKTLQSTPIGHAADEEAALIMEPEAEWSECVGGMQTRRKTCALPICGLESRECEDAVTPEIEEDLQSITTSAKPSVAVPTRQEIAAVKEKIRRDGFKCSLNECCKVFDSCNFGIRHNSTTRQLEWCKKPCRSGHF